MELEIGEELEVASWKDFDQPAKALEGSEEIGDAWMLKHVRPCLQWSIPLLHRTSRHASHVTLPDTESCIASCNIAHPKFAI